MTREEAKRWKRKAAQNKCKDAISRSEVHDLMATWISAVDGKTRETLEVIDGKIEDLPSVIPKKSGWIPVSERLPEEDGGYLVTRRDLMGEPTLIVIRSYAKDLYSVDDFDFLDKKGIGGWYSYDGEYGFWEDTEVVAWMPLPEPYTEGSEEQA